MRAVAAGPNRSILSQVNPRSGHRDTPRGAPAVASPTLGDLGGVLADSVAALTASQRALRIDGVRLADAGDEGGDRDVLVAHVAPERVPRGVVAVVARRGSSERVPVLVPPDGVPWGAVLADVVDAIDVTPRRAAERARAALRVPLVEGGGWDRLADVASQLLGAGVAVVDDHLDVLAAAAPSGDGGDLRTELPGDATTLRGFLEADAAGQLRVGVPGAGERPVAAVVVRGEAPLPRSHAAVLDELVAACAIEWSRQELRTATESQLRGDLIRELMAGESISRESLIRRARHLGADLAGGAVAVLGAVGDPATAEPPDDRVTRRLVRLARGVIDLHWPQALVDWDGARLLLLLPGPRDDADVDRAAVEQRAHALTTRLVAAASESVPGLTLAISRFTPDPERLGAALEEAGLALAIGARLGRSGDVITFEETGTYKLLFQIFAERPEELSGFYQQTIAPLVRYDEQYQTELVGTMSTYLELDCNLSATAATLFTHRHTVRYRLDRIAELSGLEIGRTEDREQLTLGLKAMRLLGKAIPVPLAKEANLRAPRPG